ncbi:hypothetical protein [Massilia cavernae]|uniref:Uncharacterized protein n=1 Tax=Massilia cavernae TaxID=2320864 RepID=A0A418Y886_9BURK|nr:hypothetical protein [Massilia cavernae]RJG27651.1 hypothetical protein D3872_00715 [Massilia cavernae]
MECTDVEGAPAATSDVEGRPATASESGPGTPADGGHGAQAPDSLPPVGHTGNTSPDGSDDIPGL